MAKKTSLVDIAKTSAAASFGVFGTAVIFVLGALLFLVPGAVIIMMQLKKDKKKRSTAMLVLGFALAFIGVAFGMGMGLGAVMELLMGALGGSGSDSA